MHEKNSEIDALTDRLRFALRNQIEWQKYAEGKNLVLFTLTGATLLTIFDKYKGDHSFEKETFENLHFSINYKIFVITTLLAFMISIISFLINIFLGDNKEQRNYFISWRFIRKKKMGQLKKLADSYDVHMHHEDLINQHLLGSKQTYQKYIRFDVGAILYLLGIIILLLPLIKQVLLS
jgi:hypothetical protein